MADDTLSAPLKVSVPLMTLVPGGMGGTQTFVTELIRGLHDQPLVDLTVSVPRAAASLIEIAPFHVVGAVSGGASNVERLASQVCAELSPAARDVFTWANVVYYPLTIPSPRPPRDVPYVVALHDVQHLDQPKNFSRGERLYRRFRYDLPTQRASAVITISDFSRDRIVRRLGVDPDRVHVAHLGVDPSAFAPHYGHRDDFVLYPARGWPHKNHRRLIQAMEVVRRSHRGMRLVLTGGALERLTDVPDWVDVRGLVSRSDLSSLYQHAAALAFPSLYEGFGLPLLEAMASGCPVAASNAGSLPEIVGEAGVLFDPTDSSAIAAGIEASLDNSEELARRGVARAKAFTWAACVERHVDVLNAVVTSRR
jgi:glycosyltransferase involved in cell wall biosynthesis